MANLFGTGINQIPTNGMLGNLAFQDKAYVGVDAIGIGTTFVDSGTVGQVLQVSGGAYVSGSVGIGTTNPQDTLDVGLGTIRLYNKSSPTRFSQIYQDGALNFKNSNGGDDFQFLASSNSLMVLKGSGPLILPGNASLTGTASQRLQVTGGAYVSGNLGVGVTNPSFKLDVSGLTAISNSQSQLLLHQASNTPTVIHRNDGSDYYILLSDNSTTPNITWNALRPLSITLSTGRLNSNNGQYFTGNTLIGSATPTPTGTASQPLQVTGGAYVSGNLGIGATNPGATLNVVPTATSIAGLFSGTTSSDMVRITQLGTGNALVVEDSANPDASPFVVNQLGNVGIGTNTISPVHKLHVQGNLLVAAGSSTGQHITQNAYELNSGTLSWEGSAGQLFSITNNLTSGSIFSVNDVSGIPSIDVDANGTVSMVAYGGNTGIGTTNPTSKLHVVGVVSATSFSGSGTNLTGIVTSIVAGTNVTISSSAGQFTINSTASGGGSSQWVTTAAGIHTLSNVGIGTTNPTSKLHVVGNTLVTGIVTATDFNSTSDINLKENIKTVKNSLSTIEQLRGVSFDWKENDRSSYGVIAQEVERVLPELVHGDNPKTVNYNGIIGVLIEAIKELKKEVEDLKSNK